MRNYKLFTTVCCVLFSLMLTNYLAAQDLTCDAALKIDGDKQKGFYWPFLLYVPGSWIDIKKNPCILILPNNTGKVNDDFSVHEKSALKLLNDNVSIAKQLNVILLVPIFPRSEKDWKIYTHALDRDVLITDNDSLKRLDLQLIAMINEARKKLAEKTVEVDKKILIMGFSASGMFANRFALLHPDLVKGAAIGSPGGWPILPLTNYGEQALNYPVGVADLKMVAGKEFDEENYRKIPQYFFIGEDDTNDSVPYDDSYDLAEREVIMNNFGASLIERWKTCEGLFAASKYDNAVFVTYPNVGHGISKEMKKDLIKFFTKVLNN